ncbi:hypothetical protein HOA55_05275 [archaeon]|jgi:hypothetical protein|nr:hypothetical protein [archaeon]MBT3577733.1 hypothetical protein [archaeon]MBT6820740.1 hypothetical protein [archaeon]MBT6956417.1 hypothetical protein [archaeon]MBT7025880.1 hypothetical protein [archaeon]
MIDNYVDVETGIKDTKTSLETLRQDPSSDKLQGAFYKQVRHVERLTRDAWMEHGEEYGSESRKNISTIVQEGIELIRENPNPWPTLPEDITKNEFDKIISENPGKYGGGNPTLTGSWYYLKKLRESHQLFERCRTYEKPKISPLTKRLWKIRNFLGIPLRIKLP